MHRTSFLFIFIVLAFSIPAHSQDTLFNQTDPRGLKQGFWKGYYPSGTIKYTGFFKDGKPSGEFKRYDEEGYLKATLNHQADGSVQAIIHYANGKKAAEGKYINEQKEGIWNYYSYYSGSLTLQEVFVNGKREGQSTRYYEDGKTFYTVDYVGDKKHGPWIEYFEDGGIMLEGSYAEDKREGSFKTFYGEGKPEITGHFVNDQMHGTWTYFNEQGDTLLMVEYKHGIAQNPEMLEKVQQEFFKKVEENKGKIAEPDENDFVPPR